MPTERSREDELIETFFFRHSADGDRVLIGPGDDAAMLRCPPGEQLLITTDTLNEGVHFPAGAPASSIGYRALAVSLSDLAAMAARPLWAVVTLSVPAVEEDWLSDFADGLYALADEYGVRVVGGDFVRGPLSITVTAHGSTRQGAALRRDGASAGDGIWVSGFLGDAAAGLEALEQRLKARALPPSSRARTPSLPADRLIRRFCYPEPRVQLGRQLAGIASACMDLSDGLITDLPRLLRSSRLQGRIQAEKLPISAALRESVEPDKALRMAFAGGDDYELCFTAAPDNERRLEGLSSGDLPLTRIGCLYRGEGLVLRRGEGTWEPPDSGFPSFFVKGRLIQLAGSGLGLGYLPLAPGTWGSLGGLLMWWLTLPLGRPLQVLLLVLAAVPAVFVCGACARKAQRADPPWVVLDEVLGMFLALLFLRPALLGIAVAFVLFRLLDIFKPWPVSLMEKRFSGGAAILLDDLLAGAIAALIMVILQIFITFT